VKKGKEKGKKKRKEGKGRGGDGRALPSACERGPKKTLQSLQHNEKRKNEPLGGNG